jgi:MYXO-CTERM domain-containing protein
MEGVRRLVAFALASLAATSAEADVSYPYPGLTLVTHPGTAMVIADLCASGVSVRATRYEERKQTPEGWGSGLGLQAAVNADFFDFPAATYVRGRARGAGADWPPGTQNVELAQGEVRQYWQFGPRIAELVAPATNAPNGAATEIVGAHNVIIQNGQSLAPNFDGDAVLFGSYRRTSIGLSADHAKLYLFSSNNLMTGAQLAQAVLDDAAEGGAPNVDFAANEDGGGSSQLFVAGMGQLVTSGRLVANHLGVFATGQGDAPMCPSAPPIGYLDGADCDHITGWTQDPDVPTQSIKVLLAFDGIFPDPNARYTTAIADVDRPDVGKAVGSSNHGFDVPTPYGLFDGKDHPILAVGEDSAGLRSALLVGTKTVTCAATPPKSLKRHVLDPDVYAAWNFSAFEDLMKVPDAVLDAIPESSAIDAPPVLVQADDGTPEVWLVDGTTRRHVTSPASARAWHFDLGAVKKEPAGQVYALTLGPPLRFRPLLAQGSGPAIYLLDALPGEGAPPPGADAGADGGTSMPNGDAPGAAGCACTMGPSSKLTPAPLALVALALMRRRRREEETSRTRRSRQQ